MDAKTVYEKHFRTRMGGYNMAEVDAFLDEVAKAMDQAEADKKRADSELAEARKKLEYYQGMENSLRDTLVGAQTYAGDTMGEARAKAAEVVAEARRYANEIRAEAEQQAKDALAGLEDAKAQIAEFKAEVRRMMSAQLDALDACLAESKAQPAAVSSEGGAVAADEETVRE